MSVYTFEGYDPSVITVSGGTLTLSPTFNHATDIVSITIDEAGGTGNYLSGDSIVDEQADDSTQYLFGTTDGIYSEDIFTLSNGTKVTSIEVEGTLIGYLIVGTPLSPGVAYTITLTENPGDSSSGALRYDEINQVLCFSGPTLIETDQGPRPAELVSVGDYLVTADNGLRKVRWVQEEIISPDEMRANPKLRPVRISAGALGAGLPRRDLVVSPQHRVLIRAMAAQRMFATSEVLVAARHLVALEGIDFVNADAGVKYVHLMCDAHELVFAEGVACETLFPGKQVFGKVSPLAANAIRSFFSFNHKSINQLSTVRHVPDARHADKLACRLAKNKTVARCAIAMTIEHHVCVGR